MGYPLCFDAMRDTDYKQLTTNSATDLKRYGWSAKSRVIVDATPEANFSRCEGRQIFHKDLRLV